MWDEDTTRQFSPADGEPPPPGRTLDDLCGLVESLCGEVARFRARVEEGLLDTTPLAETLEAVRGEVRGVAARLAALGAAVAEVTRAARRIERKVNGISIACSE